LAVQALYGDGQDKVLDAHQVRESPTLLVVHAKLVPFWIDCWTSTLPQARCAKTGRLATVIRTGAVESPAWRMRRRWRDVGATFSDAERGDSFDMTPSEARRAPRRGQRLRRPAKSM